jgi:hypothetical protein
VNLQVRSNLFCNLMSSLAGSADPQVLAAMVALADVSSSSGTEQWVAQCADKYMCVHLQCGLTAVQSTNLAVLYLPTVKEPVCSHWQCNVSFLTWQQTVAAHRASTRCHSVAWACWRPCREMQQHVAALQAELKAAQAAADLEATLKEFKTFIDNGQYNKA